MTNKNPIINKIDRLVQLLNNLIEIAVDSDGDKIGIVDTSGTWEQPDYYNKVIWNGINLKISFTSGYDTTILTDTIRKEYLETDGVETLNYLIRLYKKALKKNKTVLSENKIIKVIRLIESLTSKKVVLKEALTEVQDDVNYIYSFFKEDIDKIQKTGFVDKEMFNYFKLNTSDLVDPICKKAHELNPCVIYINPFKNKSLRKSSTNHYNPVLKEICITIHTQAFELASVDYPEMEIGKIGLMIKSKTFEKEFTEEKLKGTINHELAHWIDDSLNNNHIDKTLKSLNKKRALDSASSNPKGLRDINLHTIEIQGIIHNVLQAKIKYEKEWDEMTFSDLVSIIPSLDNLTNILTKSGDYNEWSRKLKTRMAREGLLGKKMKNND